MILWLALACAPTAPSDALVADPDAPAVVAPHVRAGLTLSPSTPAFDPLRGGRVSVFLTGEPGDAVTLRPTVGSTELAALAAVLDDKGAATVDWDGRDAAGEVAPLGAVTLTATYDAGDDSASAVVALVHTGFLAVYAEDDGGTTATAIPMFWGGDSVLQDLGLPISAVPALDDADGAAIPFPPVTSRLAVASAVDGAWPVAWSAGSRPILTLEPSAEHGGADAAVVHVAAPGWTVIAGDPLVAGQPVTLQRAAPLDDTLGVTDEDVAVALFVDGPQGPVTLSEQVIPTRAYRLLGPPTFGHVGDRYHPWAWPVDDALRALEGTPAEHDAVADAVVDWVFNDLGLVYDTAEGASAYSEYGGVINPQWDEVHFYFTAFLQRSFGDVINCTDAGNIVSTWSNMLGAELHHVVILENFDLDFIRAIGTTEFTRCPFGPLGCGFSYHAVTTPDGGGMVWDATLVLDGDNNPGRAPFTDLPVQGIGGVEYLNRLVRVGNARFRFESQGTIQ